VTRHSFVASLPDLIDPGEYGAHPEGNLVRLRITVTDDGVEVLGDGMRPAAIEAVLTALSAAGDDGPAMEQMLCG
jgi:hypothetical protein